MSRRRDEPPDDAALDAGLRRIFRPPERVALPPALSRTAGSGQGPAGAGVRPVAHAAPLGGGAWGWRVLLAGAASVAAVLWLAGRGPRAPGQAPPSGSAAVARAGAERPGPPLDLGRLYLEATLGRGMAECTAPDDLEALQGELSARCGAGVRVDARAAGILHGPFGSPEWPEGTVLAGYPEGPGGRPAVLLAGCGTSPACCLSDGAQAGGGGLRLFSSRVGDLVLTEITPLDEPRLLQYFEAR